MPLMYNDFVIVGPVADPAGIKGMESASEAFITIASKNAKFLTRRDKSGTNIAELAIWKKAGIVPQGTWYLKGLKDDMGNKAKHCLFPNQKHILKTNNRRILP
jgi:tungstate transport system substrate-binding protein